MASSDWPECEVHYCMIIADLDNARTDDPGCNERLLRVCDIYAVTGKSLKFVDFKIVIQLISVLVCL